MIFTFTSQFQGFGSPKTTMEFEADHISDVVRYFEQFLRGSGYHFEGELDLCNNTEPAPNNCDNECSGCVCESEEQAYMPSMTMPGTIGGAKLTFPEERCTVCKLTREQLGDHQCYDTKCGLK